MLVTKTHIGSALDLKKGEGRELGRSCLLTEENLKLYRELESLLGTVSSPEPPGKAKQSRQNPREETKLLTVTKK